VKKQAKFGVGISVIVASLGFLAWLGYGESKTYYHTIAELETLKGSAMNQRMRIGGTVASGSIRHLQGRVDFVLEGEGKTLPVSYIGTDPLPDTFIDKSQALVEGHAGPEGRFVAEVVQAKCASKYEAAPGGKGGAAPSATEPRGM
jgi:cytochrome c-type biogenesis protein CcmE